PPLRVASQCRLPSTRGPAPMLLAYGPRRSRGLHAWLMSVLLAYGPAGPASPRAAMSVLFADDPIVYPAFPLTAPRCRPSARLRVRASHVRSRGVRRLPARSRGVGLAGCGPAVSSHFPCGPLPAPVHVRPLGPASSHAPSG